MLENVVVQIVKIVDVELVRFDPDEEEYIKTCMSIIK